MDKSKDRRGSSRSLIGSLIQRASSFRSINKKSPKRTSATEFVDMDPKFTNVEFKFNQNVSVWESIIEKLLNGKTFERSYYMTFRLKRIRLSFHCILPMIVLTNSLLAIQIQI